MVNRKLKLSVKTLINLLKSIPGYFNYNLITTVFKDKIYHNSFLLVDTARTPF